MVKSMKNKKTQERLTLDDVIFKEPLNSRKNVVFIATFKDTDVVVKRYRDLSLCQNQLQILRKMQGTGYSPRILGYGRDYTITSYIDGSIFEELFSDALKTNNSAKFKKLAMSLAVFLQMFHSVTGKNFGDANFKNFIVSQGKCYGIDFEMAQEGLPAIDVATTITHAIATANFNVVSVYPFIKTLLNAFHLTKIDIINDLKTSLELYKKQHNLNIDKNKILNDFIILKETGDN